MCDDISWDPAHHKALCNHPSVSTSILKQPNSCGIAVDQAHRVISQAAGGTSRSSRRSLSCPCAGGADCYNLSLFSTCFILLSLQTFVLAGIDSKVQNTHQSDRDSGSAVCHRSLLRRFYPTSPLDGSRRTQPRTPPPPPPPEEAVALSKADHMRPAVMRLSPCLIRCLSLCIQERHNLVFGFLLARCPRTRIALLDLQSAGGWAVPEAGDVRE